MDKTIAKICEVLTGHDHFLVVSHAMPDGDAIGAQLGMGEILRRLNKNCRFYNISGFPVNFDWINPGLMFAKSMAELDDFKPEVCIFLDCGDQLRAGPEMQALIDNKVFPLSISIDHHRENPEFATVNWVDSSASATAYMVAQIAKALELPLTGLLGRAIYLGLVDDTGSFSYTNTDARTLALAAEIVELGLNVGQFNTCRENTWSMERFRFWGRLSNSVRMAHNRSIAYVCVTQAMLDEAGLTIADVSDFASWMRRIRGTAICALIREHGAGLIKVSLRSAVNVNVQQVAVKFGGGGHINAAAMEVAGEIETVAERLLPELIKAIDSANPPGSCKSQ